ncbi:MAG: hypothetical protein V1792_05805 [Pseudomonadota bacterium]
MSEEIDQTEHKPENLLTSLLDDRLVEFIQNNPALVVGGVIVAIIVTVLSIKYESFVKLLGVVFSAPVVIGALVLYLLRMFEPEIRILVGRVTHYKHSLFGEIDLAADAGKDLEERVSALTEYMLSEDQPNGTRIPDEFRSRALEGSMYWFFNYLDSSLGEGHIATLQFLGNDVSDDDLYFDFWSKSATFCYQRRSAFDVLIRLGLCVEDNGKRHVTVLGRAYLEHLPKSLKKDVIDKFNDHIKSVLSFQDSD